MKFQELPLGVQKLVEADYKRHMQENFKEIEGEVMLAFLQQDDIQKKWADYRNAAYYDGLMEAEREGAWDEFLLDQLGLDG